MLAHIQVSGTATVVTPPSGWTLDNSDTTANGHSFIYRKVASSEGTSYTWAMNTGSTVSTVGAISSFYNASSSIGASSKNIGDVDTTAEGTAITPVVSPQSLLVAFVGSATASAYSAYAIVNNNPTWTEAFDNNVDSGANDASQAMAYATWEYASTTGAFSATQSVSGDATVYFYSLKPSTANFTDTIGGVTIGGIAPTYTQTLNYVDTIGGVTISGASVSVTQRDNIWTNETKPSTTWTNETL
jgi:hypothetical protein